MIWRVALLAAAICLSSCQRAEGANPSAADEQRCGSPGTHAEQIACRDGIAARSRAQMLKALEANRVNARALDAEYDASFPNPATEGHWGFARNLDLSQAEWAKYAEAQCRYEAAKRFGGSGGWDLEAKCKDRLNRQRLAELNGLLAEDRDSGVITSRK